MRALCRLCLLGGGIDIINQIQSLVQSWLLVKYMHKIFYVQHSEEQTSDSIYSQKYPVGLSNVNCTQKSCLCTSGKEPSSLGRVYDSGSALGAAAVASSFYCAQLFLWIKGLLSRSISQKKLCSTASSISTFRWSSARDLLHSSH